MAPSGPESFNDAAAFVSRRDREAARDRIEALGGMLSEADAKLLVAAFEGPDVRAIDRRRRGRAFLAPRGPDSEESIPKLIVSAAISAGVAQVGSTRVRQSRESRWVFGIEGEPVERARELARAASGAGVLVDDETAAAVSDRFRLQSTGGGTYAVLAPREREDEADAASAPLTSQIKTILVTDIVGSTHRRTLAIAPGQSSPTGMCATRSELVVFGGERSTRLGMGSSRRSTARRAIPVRARADGPTARARPENPGGHPRARSNTSRAVRRGSP